MFFTAPLFLIAFLCWVPLQKSRHPFRYSCQNLQREMPLWEEKEASERFLRIASINTSLMPESDARSQNLSHTQERARTITRAIVDSQTGGQIKQAPRRRQASVTKTAVDHENIMLSQARGSLDQGFPPFAMEGQNETSGGAAPPPPPP